MPPTSFSSSSSAHRGPFATSDTRTILFQILTLQAGFYLILGVSCLIAVGAMLGKAPTLASLFAAEPGHVEALPVVFAHVLTAPVAAFLVGYVVSSASQVFDQVATVCSIHLVLRIILFHSFPSNLAFWAALGFDAVVMVVVGELIGRRRELQELRSAVGSLNEHEHDGQSEDHENNRTEVNSSGNESNNNNASTIGVISSQYR